MATWYTDTTNAPKIMRDGYRYDQRLSWYGYVDSTAPAGYKRTIVEANYEHQFLTYAAADSIAAAKRSASTDSHEIDASWFRMNDAGAYGVRVSEHTRGAWVAVV